MMVLQYWFDNSNHHTFRDHDADRTLTLVVNGVSCWVRSKNRPICDFVSSKFGIPFLDYVRVLQQTSPENCVGDLV